MSVTISNRSGDALNDTFIDSSVLVPDAGGGSLTFTGSVQAVGGTVFPLTGSPLVCPAVPGSGSTYRNLQADATTGAVTLQTSAAADPAPINANNIVIFRQTLTFGSSGADIAYDGSNTPDQPV